jgi:predicted alpha/beta superfamily hydrolase
VDFNNIKASKKNDKWLLFSISMILIFLSTAACGFFTAVVGTASDAPSEASPPLVIDFPIEGDESFITDPDRTSRVESFSMAIPQLDNRDWTFEIYLPPDYDESDKSYPVIYLLDGQYLFNPPTESGGDYRIDEWLDRFFYEGILEGMIAVSIWHDNNFRWDVYTPWIIQNMHDWVKPGNSDPVEGGEGFEFTAFIVETLKPEIDSRYRTLADRENTAIGGFCRTALIPVLAGLEYPEVFSQVMVISPTVWLAEGGGQWLSNNQLINYIDSLTVPNNVRFFIHTGTNESSGNRPPINGQDGKRITYPQAYLEGAERLTTALLENGAPESNVYFEIIEGSAGGRDLWGSRFPVALMWLMGLE